jgi:hypothetical protein
VRAEDFDGIDSVWVRLGTVEQVQDARFSRSFTWRYRFIVPVSGQAPGTHVDMTFRTRDAAGFEAQRDTYVVAIP